MFNFRALKPGVGGGAGPTGLPGSASGKAFGKDSFRKGNIVLFFKSLKKRRKL